MSYIGCSNKIVTMFGFCMLNCIAGPQAVAGPIESILIHNTRRNRRLQRAVHQVVQHTVHVVSQHLIVCVLLAPMLAILIRSCCATGGALGAAYCSVQ